MLGQGIGNRCVILVMGVHRSGTSALTGALARTGARLPRDLLMPRPDNRDGFFESERIVSLHDEVLAAAQSTWDDAGGWTEAQRDIIRESRFRHRLWTLLRQDLPGPGPLLIKDPRLCRLLPLWDDLAAERGLDLRHVLAVRHPAEVAASLAVRNGMPPPAALRLWLRSYLDAERHTRGRFRIATSYDVLLREKSRFVLPLARSLGLAGAASPRTMALEVDALLRDDRRHHHAASRDDRPGTVMALYEWLLNGLQPEAFPAAALDEAAC